MPEGRPASRTRAERPDAARLQQKVQRALPYSLGIALMQIALSLVAMLLLVRYLAPGEYGVWALLLGAPGLVNLWISFGFHNYISRFLPARTDVRVVADEVWAIVVRRLALAATMSIALVVCFPLYASRFELSGYFEHLATHQIALVLGVGTIYLDLAMRARFLQKQILGISLSVQTLIVIATAVGIQRGETLIYFVRVIALTSALNFAAFAVVFGLSHGGPRLRQLARPPRLSAEATSYRRATYIAGFGVALLHTDIDRYLIGFLSNNVQVALYAVAATIYVRLLQLLPTALFQSLLDATFFSRFEERGDESELNRMFRFIFKVNAICIFYFIAIFVPAGHRTLELVFQETYSGAYTTVVIFLACMTFTTMPVNMTLMALKKSRILVYAQSPLILNFALGIPLVIRYGAPGMAFATAISAVLKNTIMYIYARRFITLEIPWETCLRCGLAATLGGAVVHLALPRFGLVVAAGSGTVVYLFLIRVLRPMNSDERGLLAKIIPDRLGFTVPLFLGPREH